MKVREKVCPQCGSTDISSDVDLDNSDPTKIISEYDFCFDCGYEWNVTERKKDELQVYSANAMPRRKRRTPNRQPLPSLPTRPHEQPTGQTDKNGKQPACPRISSNAKKSPPKQKLEK